LEAGAVTSVLSEVKQDFSRYRGEIWEELVRDAVAHINIEGKDWLPGQCWWGAGSDKTPFEIDVLAESADCNSLLVCEVKSTITSKGLKRIEGELRHKAQLLPIAKSYPRVIKKIVVASAGNTRAKSLISGGVIFNALK